MKALSELLHADLVIAEIDAHPDDFVVLAGAHAAADAVNPKPRKHNYTLTAGEATTKNHHRDPKFDPKAGHRETEGRLGAHRIGFETYTQLDGTDGSLLHDRKRLVPIIASLILDDEVNLILSLAQFGEHDSPDHAAAGYIAVEAARQVHETTGRSIGVLVAQPGMQGEWHTPASVEAARLAHVGAAANPSQFRYRHPAEQPDWPVAENGLAIHPQDHAELDQYPLGRKATYTLIEFGSLVVPQLTEVAQ